MMISGDGHLTSVRYMFYDGDMGLPTAVEYHRQSLLAIVATGAYALIDNNNSDVQSTTKYIVNAVRILTRKPPSSRLVPWESMKNLMAKVSNGKIAE